MTNKILEARKYLAHNIRHDLSHFRLCKRECEKLVIHIEETLNVYLEMLEVLGDGNESQLSNGENSKVE